jgi:hypothetical protein
VTRSEADESKHSGLRCLSALATTVGCLFKTKRKNFAAHLIAYQDAKRPQCGVASEDGSRLGTEHLVNGKKMITNAKARRAPRYKRQQPRHRMERGKTTLASRNFATESDNSASTSPPPSTRGTWCPGESLHHLGGERGSGAHPHCRSGCDQCEGSNSRGIKRGCAKVGVRS